MKTINLILIFSVFSVFLSAQTSIESILLQIEQNNTVLSTLRQQAEAEKTGNKTGIYLENPEVEFHYLWGNNAVVGNRTDFSASQSFDFPTAYHYKRKVAGVKNTQVDLKYQVERKNILLEAKQICIELIYQNALYAELTQRLQHAQQIADAYQVKYDKGEINILDINKAKINLLNAKNEMNTLKTDNEQLQAELTRLNGGKGIDLSITEYAPVQLPDNFEQWITGLRESNLFLKSLEQETAISRENEKLQRSMNLPKFSAGYMSEKVADEHFQGLMIGVSIPLWENKNTVKQIKAQTRANQAAENDAMVRFNNQVKALYDKALKLRQIANNYKENIAVVNSSGLLKKALDAGEISLIEYMMELGVYYEATNNILQAERDYQLIMTELQQWEL